MFRFSDLLHTDVGPGFSPLLKQKNQKHSCGSAFCSRLQMEVISAFVYTFTISVPHRPRENNQLLLSELAQTQRGDGVLIPNQHI